MEVLCIILCVIIGPAVIAAFLFGLKEGKKLREIRTIERVVEAGVTEQKTENVTPVIPVEPNEEEKKIAKSLEALSKHEAKYTGSR